MEHTSTDFEPGYDRVVQLDFSGSVEGYTDIRVGRRRGRVRVEAGTDRAWEFDPAGRLLVAQERGRSLHPTLDGRIWGHRVVGSGAGRRLVADPGPTDPVGWLARIHGRVRAWQQAAAQASWVRGTTGAPEGFAAEALEPAARRDAVSLAAEFDRARRIWRRVPVLPPDLYEALVVQISEGCPWDRCRFCTLYREVAYRERSPEEVERHLGEILEFLGPSVTRFRRIFLGQANALLRETGELLGILERIRERVRICDAGLEGPERRAWLEANAPSVDGVYSFVDAFHRPRPVDEWRSLREAGLRRVYIGLESGDAVQLRQLGKPLEPERAVRMVADLHAAGLPVALIVLTGIGRPDAEARHREATARVLAAMDLRVGDQVYLSPLIHPAGAPIAAGLPPEKERMPAITAFTEMRATLRPAIGRGVPVARYDLVRLAERTPRG